MKPILVRFSKYTPSIHTIDNYYSILSSSKFESNAESLKINEEMNKSSDNLINHLFKPEKNNMEFIYI